MKIELVQEAFRNSMSYLYPDGWQPDMCQNQFDTLVRTFTMGCALGLKATPTPFKQFMKAIKQIMSEKWHAGDSWKWLPRERASLPDEKINPELN